MADAYDPWGIPLPANTGRFQYTGQIWVPELGLYYYKARWYSPTIGRFLQTDPIGYEGGANLYAHAVNDPLNRTDPTGLKDEENYFDKLKKRVDSLTTIGRKIVNTVKDPDRRITAGVRAAQAAVIARGARAVSEKMSLPPHLQNAVNRVENIA